MKADAAAAYIKLAHEAGAPSRLPTQLREVQHLLENAPPGQSENVRTIEAFISARGFRSFRHALESFGAAYAQRASSARGELAVKKLGGKPPASAGARSVDWRALHAGYEDAKRAAAGHARAAEIRSAEAKVGALAGTPFRDSTTLISDLRREADEVAAASYQTYAFDHLLHPKEIELFAQHFVESFTFKHAPVTALEALKTRLSRGDGFADGTAPAWREAIRIIETREASKPATGTEGPGTHAPSSDR